MTEVQPENRRILIVDDNADIHADFRTILTPDVGTSSFAEEAAILFGKPAPATETLTFEVESAYQGEEAVELVHNAADRGQPYAMAFVDVRMPPGCDGIETISRLWDLDPELQAVICTAYTDFSYDEIVGRLGTNDRYLILKKPFDPAEVRQLAVALTEKRRLAATVRQQTQALTDAKQAAEDANAAKSEFLANMSHEIRTPLTAILGYAEVLLEESNDSVVQESAEIIRRNGDALLDVISDILDLSKIEAGKISIETLPVSPLQLARDVESLLSVRTKAKGISILVETDGAIPETIQTDPMRLRQILINLVGNAVKFTEVGEIRLTMRLLDEESDNPKLQFNVRDTGIGMNEQQLSRVFEAFSQADASTTRRFGGTGLGLTISQRLAQLLGGDISAESRPGEGSTFRVNVPTGSLKGVRIMNAENYPHELKRPEKLGKIVCKPSSINLNCRVLLAEDGPDNQRLISLVLRKAGADVTVAENGQIAYEMAIAASCAGDPFALILMDMHMPVLDGYAAVAKLREDGYTGPIVALTAHSMSGAREKCLMAGCDDYASKPIVRNDLVALIAKYSGEPHLAVQD